MEAASEAVPALDVGVVVRAATAQPSEQKESVVVVPLHYYASIRNFRPTPTAHLVYLSDMDGSVAETLVVLCEPKHFELEGSVARRRRLHHKVVDVTQWYDLP